jgi:hypothetical protein
LERDRVRAWPCGAPGPSVATWKTGSRNAATWPPRHALRSVGKRPLKGLAQTRLQLWSRWATGRRSSTIACTGTRWENNQGKVGNLKRVAAFICGWPSWTSAQAVSLCCRHVLEPQPL